MQITDEIQADKVVLTLSGCLDFCARQVFHHVIGKTLLTQSNNILLNFSHVSDIIYARNLNAQGAKMFRDLYGPSGRPGRCLRLGGRVSVDFW